MKVPIRIQKAIKNAGRYTELHKKNEDIIREWLIKNDLFEDNEDNLVDCVCTGVDSSSTLIEILEKGSEE